MSKTYSSNIQMGKQMASSTCNDVVGSSGGLLYTTTTTTTTGQTTVQPPSTALNNTYNAGAAATSEEYLNRKIAFIQNHINNLLIEITNLPEPWTYAITEDGRVFFIK